MKHLAISILLLTSVVTKGADAFVFDTISDLLSWPGSSVHPNFEVKGYTEVGDWGATRAGKYITNSTATVDSGCVFMPTNGVGRFVFEDCESGEVYATWFGATGDGTTDDTAAIQAAFNYAQGSLHYPWSTSPATTNASVVTIPTGRYRASNLLITDGITIRGAGDGTVIQQIDGATGDLLKATGVANWTVRDLVLDGNNYNFTTNTLTTGGNVFTILTATPNIQNFLVKDIVIRNGNTNGMYLECGAAIGRVENVTIRYCKGVGIRAYFVNDTKFTGLDIALCTRGAFWMTYSANCTVSNSKFWGNRILGNIFTSEYLVPSVIAIADDDAAVIVTGVGHRWSNIDIQENGSIGMRIGTPQLQVSSSTFQNMLIDGNGGIDTTANTATNLLYQRDGLQFINYYNVAFNGVIDDFRARQGKGRQRRGLVFLSKASFVTFTEASVAGFAPLQPDDWYRIMDITGGAIFTNIQYSLTTKLNATNDVFQAQTYDYSTPIAQSWGTSGKLEAANDYANLDVRIVNQLDQNEGINDGYTITEAGPNCKFNFNGSWRIGPSDGLLLSRSGITNTGAAPIWAVTATNGASGFRLSVQGASADLLRIQSNYITKFSVKGQGQIGLTELESAPTAALANGQLYFNTTNGLTQRRGGVWEALSNVPIAPTNNGAYILFVTNGVASWIAHP